MKKKLNRKLMKQTVDVIENNLEQHLHRVHEWQLGYLSGCGNRPEVCATRTKDELVCIAESMLWIRRYVPEFDSYTSKDGRCTVELSFDDPYHSFTTDIKEWPYSRRPFPPLTRSNPSVSVKVVMSGFPGGVTRSLEYTVKRKTMDDILREKSKNINWVR